MLEAASKSTLFGTVIICISDLAGTQLGRLPHRHLAGGTHPEGSVFGDATKRRRWLIDFFFFPPRTLLDHGKTCSASLSQAALVAQDPRNGRVPTKRSPWWCCRGDAPREPGWELVQLPRGVRVCRSRCQAADDHPEPGVNAKVKLGGVCGVEINDNLISER